MPTSDLTHIYECTKCGAAWTVDPKGWGDPCGCDHEHLHSNLAGPMTCVSYRERNAKLGAVPDEYRDY